MYLTPVIYTDNGKTSLSVSFECCSRVTLPYILTVQRIVTIEGVFVPTWG